MGWETWHQGRELGGESGPKFRQAEFAGEAVRAVAGVVLDFEGLRLERGPLSARVWLR